MKAADSLIYSMTESSQAARLSIPRWPLKAPSAPVPTSTSHRASTVLGFSHCLLKQSFHPEHDKHTWLVEYCAYEGGNFHICDYAVIPPNPVHWRSPLSAHPPYSLWRPRPSWHILLGGAPVTCWLSPDPGAASSGLGRLLPTLQWAGLPPSAKAEAWGAPRAEA